MYKKFKAVDERDRLLYMAGLSLTQLIGYKTARQYCMNTVLAIGDIETDEMLFFNNSIDKDVLDIQQGHHERFEDYFQCAIDAYVKDEFKEAVLRFFDRKRLRSMFECGCMSESMEYPCSAAGDTVWIRACYELEQADNAHVVASVVLIDITSYREKHLED